MNKVYFSLGSNLGDREKNLLQAADALETTARSSIYETEPRDLVDQPWFLNMAASCETNASPFELLEKIRAIERDMGRVRRIPKGPRLIDIDILLFGDEVLETPELTIPHPRMTERRFVLEPLLEVAPELRERYGKNLAEVKNQPLTRL